MGNNFALVLILFAFASCTAAESVSTNWRKVELAKIEAQSAIKAVGQ